MRCAPSLTPRELSQASTQAHARGKSLIQPAAVRMYMYLTHARRSLKGHSQPRPAQHGRGGTAAAHEYEHAPAPAVPPGRLAWPSGRRAAPEAGSPKMLCTCAPPRQGGSGRETTKKINKTAACQVSVDGFASFSPWGVAFYVCACPAKTFQSVGAFVLCRTHIAPLPYCCMYGTSF